jgi:hypothetical protein
MKPLSSAVAVLTLLTVAQLSAACRGSSSRESRFRSGVIDPRSITIIDPKDTAAYAEAGPAALAAMARCHQPACRPDIFRGPGAGELTVGLDSAATPGSEYQWHIMPDSSPGGAPQATPPCGPGLDIKNTARDSRCFELRTYTLQSGSSADVLHARFRERTMALFDKHGMTVIGFWQPVARLDQLVYMLAFRDAAARDAAWAAFNADPEWLKTRAEMRVSVDVQNTFMVATDYSPVK